MARKPLYKVLNRRVSALEGSQDVVLVELGQQGEHKLKIKIRSNAYKSQCSAVISRFDGTQWHPLYSIDGGAMKTEEGLIYKVRRPIANVNDPQPVHIGSFVDDYAALLNRAEQILF